MIFKIAVFSVVALLCLSVIILIPKHARATGGAYTSTKHGGGTTDGVVPFGGGVNRGVNPDYSPGGIYNTVNPEAGQYQAGECSHCHEPHAMFGGVEPPPLTGSLADPAGGPNAYLGMADTNPELCWYCHNNMTIAPSITAGNGRFDFYQGKTKYTPALANGGHYNNVNMLSPSYGIGSPWPRTARTGIAGHCLNCHTPHGIKETLGAEYDTTAVPAAKHVTAANPDVSADRLIPRQLIAWEEALCENCHKTGGVIGAADVRRDILKLDTVAAGGTETGSGHPLHNVNQTGSNAGATFSGRHTLKNESAPTSGSWNAYGSLPASRHVECVDCHNPHVAQNATVFQQSGAAANPNRVAGPAGIYAGGTNKGVWGISVSTTDGSTAASIRKDDTSSSLQNYSSLYLYEICLKCHSAFADSGMNTYTTYQWAPSAQNYTRWQAALGYSAGTTAWFAGTAANIQNIRLTDVAKDFATNKAAPFAGGKAAYHPVFSQGAYQPIPATSGSPRPLTTNPRWGVAVTVCSWVGGAPRWDSVLNGLSCPEDTGRGTGKRFDSPTMDFSNNFVPPWGQTSLVTCVDCHESEVETNPRGPHGSARPFILRRLDTAIQYQIYCGPNDAACVAGNTKTINYATYTDGVGRSLAALDPNNFCLNCHRADVYGFMVGNGTPRVDASLLARQPHAQPRSGTPQTDFENGAGNLWRNDNGGGNPPRGIFCMRCHGGGSIGGIHGNNGTEMVSQGWLAALYNYNTTSFTPATNRLLNGPVWNGVRFSNLNGGSGTCGPNANSPLNSCQHPTNQNFTTPAMYLY